MVESKENERKDLLLITLQHLHAQQAKKTQGQLCHSVLEKTLFRKGKRSRKTELTIKIHTDITEPKQS